MTDGMLAFLYRFARPTPDPTHERELTIEVAGERRAATLYLPHRAGPAQPAWVLLQGVTVAGRHHELLRRLGRALSDVGHLALAPEVPSWTALHVDPREAAPTIRSALAWLCDRPEVDRRRMGLIGVSVAATWALEVAAGELGRDLRAAVSLGGYGDFRRTVRAMVIGQHEWRGTRYRYTPDPYGRWIVGADLLPRLEDAAYGPKDAREAAARALHHLAHTSGRHGAPAQEPVYDPLIAQLRDGVPAAARPVWDLLAPTSGRLIPDQDAGRALAGALADAGLRAYPDLDPTGRLDGLRVPTILMHGRGDTLVPFTETLRLAAQLPLGARTSVTITRLVGHAKAEQAGPPRNPIALAGEAWRFARAMRRIVRSVEC